MIFYFWCLVAKFSVTNMMQLSSGGDDEERQCWVCFASEEDDPVAAWVHPCLCKGTTKWVHQVGTFEHLGSL